MYVDKVVLKNGGVIETELGTDIIAISASGTPSITGSVTVTGATTTFNVGTNQTFAKEVNHSIAVTTTTTATALGGNLTVAAGIGATTGAGGVLALAGGAGGNDAVGGAATLTGGAAGGGNRAGAVASVTGGAGAGTGAGGAVSVVGGASGTGATGNGGQANVTGGAALSTNAAGGSVVLTPGAKAGTGIAGGVFQRSSTGQYWKQQTAATAKADGAETVTAAQMIGGIVVFTITTGRTMTTPTGAALLAGCPAALAAGDSFEFTLITLGAGADDIATLTAGDADVTFVGDVTVGPGAAGTTSSGTWRFRYTGANAFVGYRL